MGQFNDFLERGTYHTPVSTEITPEMREAFKTGNLVSPNWHMAADAHDDVKPDRPKYPMGDRRFHKWVEEIAYLHDKKQADYGTKGDPFANVRSSQEWGVPPWVGSMVRLNDKVHRLKSYVKNGSLANEGVKDSLIDIAVYAIIALVLFEEENETEPPVVRA